MDYLAYVIIYAFIAFGILPVIFGPNHGTYTEAVKIGFVVQLTLVGTAAFIFTIMWAFHQLGWL